MYMSGQRMWQVCFGAFGPKSLCTLRNGCMLSVLPLNVAVYVAFASVSGVRGELQTLIGASASSAMPCRKRQVNSSS